MTKARTSGRKEHKQGLCESYNAGCARAADTETRRATG